MFDIKWIRANPEAFDAALGRRKGDYPKAAETFDQISGTQHFKGEARRGAAQQALGLIVTEDQIRQEIFTIPAFQNEQGQFDRMRYEQALRMSQLTEGALVQQIEQEVVRNRILSGVLGGMNAPEGMAESLYDYRNEARVAEYVTIPLADPSALQTAVAAAQAALRERIAFLDRDRALDAEVAAAVELVADGSLLAAIAQ